MKISVLIPTLGRKKELIDTIQALLRQSRLPDELVVVDQNQPSIPEVDGILAGITQFKVRHLREQSPGVAVNYNRCLEAATGEIVLFLDDDIIPEDRLIEMHLENYGDATVGGVAGRVSQPGGDQDPSAIRDIGVYHRWTGGISANFNADRRVDVQIAPGGNMSFRREVLQRAGGFDERFDGNGFFFETDGSLRVVKLGYRIVFEPRAYVKHLMAPAGGARLRDKGMHTYYYVKNGIRLYRRHSPAVGLGWISCKLLGYSLAKAVYNADPRIFLKGVQAVVDGMKDR